MKIKLKHRTFVNTILGEIFRMKLYMPLDVALGRTQQCDIGATFNESLKYFIHSAQYMC